MSLNLQGTGQGLPEHWCTPRPRWTASCKRTCQRNQPPTKAPPNNCPVPHDCTSMGSSRNNRFEFVPERHVLEYLVPVRSSPARDLLIHFQPTHKISTRTANGTHTLNVLKKIKKGADSRDINKFNSRHFPCVV